MYQNWKPGQFREIGYYLKRSLKFYDLKNEKLTPVLFTVMLAIAFFSQFAVLSYSEQISGMLGNNSPENMSKLMDNLLTMNTINIITNLVLNLISTIYLTAYIREFKGQDISTGACLAVVGRRIILILAALVLYVLAMLTGFILLIVPGIIAYVAFLFNTCIIVDRGVGPLQSLKQSAVITKGYKAQIFGVLVVFFLLPFLPSLFIMGISNTMVYVFIVSFMSVIFNLMYQRLVVNMYMDLQYGSLIG